MTEHLSNSELRKYQAREATPAVLLRWDDHLAVCAQCRSRLLPQNDLAQWADSLAPEDGEVNHLSYEQISGQAPVSDHLLQCESCRDEVADFQKFRASLKQSGKWPWWLAAAAGVVLAAGGAMMLPHRESPLQLSDNWGQREKTLVRQTLLAGKLPQAQTPADLVAKAGTLLGPSTPNLFAPLGPVASVVESDRPQFRWQELTGAASYRLEVYDAEFNLVARSRELTATAWTPEEPFERGKLYQWQVTAKRGTESIKVPSPPAPDAKFRVLDSATEQRVVQARADNKTGHLLAAVLLAEQGMKAEAIAELNQLPIEIRNLPEVQKLRQ
jgi:hypothetical protein